LEELKQARAQELKAHAVPVYGKPE
jgi:hypothetical protein